MIEQRRISADHSSVEVVLRRVAFWMPVLICTWAALGPGLPSAAPRVNDITLHMFAFVYLSAALRIAHPRLVIVMVVLTMIAYGGFIEVAQSFLPPRQAEWGDFGIDLLGITAGLLAHYFFGEKVWRLFLRLVRLSA